MSKKESELRKKYSCFAVKVCLLFSGFHNKLQQLQNDMCIIILHKWHLKSYVILCDASEAWSTTTPIASCWEFLWLQQKFVEWINKINNAHVLISLLFTLEDILCPYDTWRFLKKSEMGFLECNIFLLVAFYKFWFRE